MAGFERWDMVFIDSWTDEYPGCGLSLQLKDDQSLRRDVMKRHKPDRIYARCQIASVEIREVAARFYGR